MPCPSPIKCAKTVDIKNISVAWAYWFTVVFILMRTGMARPVFKTFLLKIFDIYIGLLFT